jgi:hypothetical protein
MFFINRMYETLRSHSVQTNRYVEEGLKKLGLREDVDFMLYPARVVDDTRIFTVKRDIERALAQYGISSMNFLQHAQVKEHDVLIFLDSRQLIYEQLHSTPVKDARVMIRSVDLADIASVHSMFYHTLPRTFDVMVHTPYTADFFGYSFPRIVGGFSEPYRSHPKKDLIVWSGRRTKGYDAALQMQKSFPLLVLDADTSPYRSDEFVAVVASAKIVISFDTWIETFGNSIMQGVANGALPLVPRAGCYRYLYPDVFLYSTEEERNEKATTFLSHYEEYEPLLESICARYYPEKTVERMLRDSVYITDESVAAIC